MEVGSKPFWGLHVDSPMTKSQLSPISLQSHHQVFIQRRSSAPNCSLTASMKSPSSMRSYQLRALPRLDVSLKNAGKLLSFQCSPTQEAPNCPPQKALDLMLPSPPSLSSSPILGNPALVSQRLLLFYRHEPHVFLHRFDSNP